MSQVGEHRSVFQGFAPTSVVSRDGLHPRRNGISSEPEPNGETEQAAQREREYREHQQEEALARDAEKRKRQAILNQQDAQKRKNTGAGAARVVDGNRDMSPPFAYLGEDDHAGAGFGGSNLHPLVRAAIAPPYAATASAASGGSVAGAAAAAAAGSRSFGADHDHNSGLEYADDPELLPGDSSKSHHTRTSVSKIIHVKSTPTLRLFQLPEPHAYLVEMNPHMRALYFFMRKLAGCEPYNPATRMASYLPQWKEDRMTALWPVNRSSPEYIESKRLYMAYKNNLHDAMGDSDAKRELERSFKNDFKSNMKFFIDGAACAAIRSAYNQLRRTPSSDIAQISLPTLLTYDTLTDVFAPCVNAFMQLTSAGPTCRGLSNAAAQQLRDTHQSRLDTLVNAKRVVDPVDASTTWQFSV